MPRFPVYERGQGLGGGATASFASDGAFTAPARALANMGGAVADLGFNIAAEEEKAQVKIRNTQDDAWFSKTRAQTAIDIYGQEQELQKQATDGAKDYTPTVRGAFDEYRKAKLAEAPSQRAAQMYQEWSDSYDVELTGRSAKFQAESELAQRTSDFAEAMNSHAQIIYADPSQYETVLKRAQDDFEGAKQWMTPEQETAAREKVEHDLKLARAKSLVDFSPADFQREVSGGDPASWRDGIASIESAGSGGYAAIGPTHKTLGRALGKYQIMEANITRWSKEAIGRSVTSEEFLASPQIQDAIFDHKFGGYVNRFGLEGAAQAWFAGPGGVGKTDRKDSLGTDVGSYGKRFIKALGGGAGFASDPRYAGLSVDEIRSLSNQAQTAVDAQATTAYASMKDALELGIATGTVMSENDILGSALNDGDKATMLGKFRTARKDEMAVSDTLAAIVEKRFTGDPFDTDTRNNVDGAALKIKERATPEQYQLAAEEIVRQSGIVPKDVLNEIRKGLESTDAEEVAAAAQRAFRLSQVDPAALGRREGGKAAQDAADDFQHYVRNMNMEPTDAAQRMIDANDPEKKRERKAMEPAAKAFLEEMADFSIPDQFDTMFGSEPSLGMSPGQALGIQAEFLAIAEDQFYRANGDPEIAQNRAVEQLKRLYGVTEMTGRKVIMKHPPENYWPKFSIADAATSLSYPVQLQNDIRELSPNANMDSVQLVTTPETDAMIKRGEVPGYAVLYQDENGVLQTIPGKLWKPDFTRLSEMQDKLDASDQAGREGRAKADQVQERQQAPFKVQKMDDFLTGEDPAFGGR